MTAADAPHAVDPPRSRRPSRSIAIAASLGLVILASAIALLARRPDDEALRRRAGASAAAGLWSEARASASRIGRPTEDDLLLLASADLALKRHDEAARALDRVAPDGTLAARKALLLGQVEQARHRARPMEAALRRALSLDPGAVAARRLLVYLYGVQERRPELIEQFAALAERGPVTIELALHWGLSLSRGPIGDPAESLSALEAFVEADPGDRASRLALAEARRRLGKLDEVDSTLAPLAEDDPDALAIRAQAAFDRGDNEVGAALLARTPSGNAALERLMGRRALLRRDGPDAVAHLKASDAADPDNADTLFVLAQALRLVGQKEEADRVARRAADLEAARRLLVDLSNSTTPPTAATFRRIASAFEALGRPAEATAWYRLAIAADPLDTEAQRALYRLRRSAASR